MPKIQIRRDTFDNWKAANPTLLSGEWALETDTNRVKIGDGTTAYNDLECFKESDNEWLNPADWIDIRSGALPNSVYFLVGHSNPVETGESTGEYVVDTYPLFSVYATVSNSGTYDVIVDGTKVATTASGTATTLDWADLYEKGTVRSGWDVTYPAALHTHVVRVTPSVGTNTISKFHLDGSGDNGSLWAHFTTTDVVDLEMFLGDTSNTRHSRLIEAVTCSSSSLKVGPKLRGAFGTAYSLVTLPTLDRDNVTATNDSSVFGDARKLKKISFINNPTSAIAPDGEFPYAYALEEVSSECALTASRYMFYLCRSLKKLPPLSFAASSNTGGTYGDYYKLFTGTDSLEDTSIDMSQATHAIRVYMSGESNHPAYGIKGLTVSNEAPFDHKNSPQLDVSYTGLDRNALVRLFKSMPYNVGYEVVGTPTIVDGVASGFSTSDTIKLSQRLNGYSLDRLEFNTKITVGASTADSKYIIGYRTNNQSGLYINSANQIAWRISRIGTAAQDVFLADLTIQQGDVVLINCSYIGSNTYRLKASLDNGATWTSTDKTVSETMADTSNYDIHIGTSHSTTVPFNGSIDLNETYIKLDGVTWFNGANAVSQRQLSSDVTVVGSPTVTSGVVSGFSQHDYVISSNSISSFNSIEIVEDVTLGNTPKESLSLFAFNSKSIQLYGGYTTSTSFRLNLGGESSSGTKVFSNGNSYKFKFIITPTAVELYYFENGQWNLDISYELSTSSVSNIRFGMRYASSTSDRSFNGSIDLNNTYIKVNDSVWMHGTDPLAKTVDIRNTTGESALSADDKNIVLNKGWALTTNNSN